MRTFWSLGACGLLALVNAQSDNLPIPCCTVPTSSIPESDRTTWCSANMNTCSQLCGRADANSCDPNNLDFDCRCSNGTDISSSMARYQQSIPSLMCLTWFTACINATGGDATAQFACETTKNSQCGDDEVGGAIQSATSSIAAEISSRVQSIASSRTTSSSSMSASGSGRSQTPPPNDTSGSESGTSSSGLSKGAIAGIVVGAVLAILIAAIVLWMCKRRRKQNRTGTVTVYDEKEKLPPGSSIPAKPELHGDHIAELPQPDPPEMYASPTMHPAQMNGNSHGNRVELPTLEMNSELGVSTPRTTEIPAPAYQAHDTTRPAPISEELSGTSLGPVSQSLEPQISQQNEAQVQPHDAALPPTQTPLWRASPEEISAWEEEERRIDAEIEEIRRVKELSDRKLAIQQKLRDARGE